MDFDAPSIEDRLARIERRVTRLTWLSIAQTIFLGVAVVMYVISLASSWMFWMTLLLIGGVTVWLMRDKSPNWLKAIGRWGRKLMQVQTEHTALTTPSAPEHSHDPGSRMAG